MKPLVDDIRDVIRAQQPTPNTQQPRTKNQELRTKKQIYFWFFLDFENVPETLKTWIVKSVKP